MADVVPHLQCSAGLHRPIISQLSVKGAGPEADDSQGEFSVREGERERGSYCVRGKVGERVSECSGAPGLSLSAQPATELLHLFYLFLLSTLRLSLPSPSEPRSPVLFATCSLYILFCSVITTDHAFLLQSTFNCLSLLLLGSDPFFSCEWSERIF